MKINNILVSKSNVYIKILENESEKDKMIKRGSLPLFVINIVKKLHLLIIKTACYAFYIVQLNMYKANWSSSQKRHLLV